MQTVCVILDVKPAKAKDDAGKPINDYWKPSVALLNEKDFLGKLKSYDKDNIPPKIIDKIRSVFWRSQIFARVGLYRQPMSWEATRGSVYCHDLVNCQVQNRAQHSACRSTYLTNEGFTPENAKKASPAAEGMCKWVHAMSSYDKVRLQPSAIGVPAPLIPWEGLCTVLTPCAWQ